MNETEEAIKQVEILIRWPTLNDWTRKQFLEHILKTLKECEKK